MQEQEKCSFDNVTKYSPFVPATLNLRIFVVEPLSIFRLTTFARLITDIGKSLLSVCKQNSLAFSQRCGLITTPVKDIDLVIY